ncbi:hypothetical protein ARMGADRAFT_1029625 [Armillaria gallica]|uniref:Uncharacterized protein n=1 Tax=Armillaria gallica TaxID=47427 RepID=A0A2H3DH61_ARMGA|nr:hypothetical protein ARMGADRAFT_1029625 [Armillaria gallica]
MRNVLPPTLQISRRIMIDVITAPFSNRAMVCHRVRHCYHEDHTEARTYTRRKMHTKPKRSCNKDRDKPASRHCMLKAQEDTHCNAGYHAQDIMSRLGKLKTGLTMVLFLTGVYTHALAVYIGDVLGGFNRLERKASQHMDWYYKNEGCSNRWHTLDSTQKAVQENMATIAKRAECPQHLWFVHHLEVYLHIPMDQRDAWTASCVGTFLLNFPELASEWNSDKELALVQEEQGPDLNNKEQWAITTDESDTWGSSTWGWGNTHWGVNAGDDRSSTWPGSENWGLGEGGVGVEVADTEAGALGMTKIEAAYTPEQHQQLHKKAIFYNKVCNVGQATEDAWLEKFYIEWFLLHPEDSKLVGLDREVAEWVHKKDLLKMLWWAYWMTPFAPEPSTTEDVELDKAHPHCLARKEQSSLQAQIAAAEATKAELARLSISDPVKTVAFYAALDALKPDASDNDGEMGEGMDEDDNDKPILVDFLSIPTI